MKIKTIVINKYGTFESDPSAEITPEEYRNAQIEIEKQSPLTYLSMFRGNQWIHFQEEMIKDSIVILEVIEEGKTSWTNTPISQQTSSKPL
jgi:hypothetical protein